jgi:hypothetical protein
MIALKILPSIFTHGDNNGFVSYDGECAQQSLAVLMMVANTGIAELNQNDEGRNLRDMEQFRAVIIAHRGFNGADK